MSNGERKAIAALLIDLMEAKGEGREVEAEEMNQLVADLSAQVSLSIHLGCRDFRPDN